MSDQTETEVDITAPITLDDVLTMTKAWWDGPRTEWEEGETIKARTTEGIRYGTLLRKFMPLGFGFPWWDVELNGGMLTRLPEPSFVPFLSEGELALAVSGAYYDEFEMMEGTVPSQE